MTQSNLTFSADFEAGVHVVIATASNGGTNRATCSTTVTVLGPLSIKQMILQELEAAEAAREGEPLRALRRAITRLRRSISEELWVDGAHLNKRHGGLVFRNEALTAYHLKTLLRTTRDEIPDAIVQTWISRLMDVDRTLAVLQINEAMTAGAGPKRVALASRRVARGDRMADRRRLVQAILLYREAWRIAAHHQR